MVCVDCLDKITATIEQSKRHGWVVWVGGARCKSCNERAAAEGRSE
jgi:dissimilatory sulfite reductase (desulfoviridin) alpha/beta subunit